MSVLALEGIVDRGLIRLPSDVKLPDRTKVYIIVPASRPYQKAHLYSPRPADPKQARDFVMEVSEERDDADL